MQQTAHYNLQKPEANDTVNVHTTMSSNMDTIDGQMYANQQAAAAAQTAAQNAQTAAQNAQTTADNATAANAATDTVIGNRTVDQTQAPPTAGDPNTGKLTQLLSWFAYSLSAVIGLAHWYDVPPTSLKTVSDFMGTKGQNNGLATLGPTGTVPTAELPIATAASVGVMKPGQNMTVGADGSLNGPAPYSLPAAGSSALGGVETPMGAAVATPIAVIRTATTKDLQITSTAQTTVASFTPTAASGNFMVMVSFRITGGAAVTVDIQTTYTSGTGAQTFTHINQSVNPGDWTLPLLFINATNATPIAVNVTVSAANVVDVSASILGV